MDQLSDDLPRGADGSGESQDRTAARDSLFLMSDLRIGDQLVTVRVRNLSAGGMMAEYPRGLEPGTGIDCALRGIGMVRGQVAWSAAGRIGIAFDQEVDPMLARKPLGDATKPKILSFTKYMPRY